MRLVGKKLYRTGPLKLFKQTYSAPVANPSGNPRYGGTGTSSISDAQKKQQKAFEEAMKKRAWLAEQAKQESAIEKKEWKDEASRKLYDTEQKGIFDKQKALAEGMGGELQKAGAERGLQAQMAAAGAGRGSAAQRMRGLARAGEAGVKSAAALGAQSGAQQAQMLGAAGKGRFGMMKSDKAGKLGFYQKSRGLDVAEKAAQAQAAATRAANSGGKASGGEIFKEFKRKNGKIEGKGTETSDDIKAMLSDGEFVVNAKTVRGIGESMGAKGKEDSRKKGAGFLYDLQTKYGDKKPIGKSAGGFTGMHMAELASNVAKSGALGKEMETVGEIGGAAVDAKKGIEKRKATADKVAKQKKEIDDLKAWKHKSEKASGAHPSKKAFEQMAKGGHINLGKGVKAKRKFREAIGWEADKIFDKKAEKDYKEGHTGYKNWKGDSVVKLGRGGLLGSIGRTAMGAGLGFVTGGPAGAVVGGASAAAKEKADADKEAAQKKANIAGGEAKAAAKTGAAGKALASEEVELKEGGAVKKDHPHYKFLKDLDKFTAHHFPKGKKVDLDPGRKADKAIRAKKGSVEPMKFQTGKLVEKNPGITSPEGKLGLKIMEDGEKQKKLSKTRRLQTKSKKELLDFKKGIGKTGREKGAGGKERLAAMDPFEKLGMDPFDFKSKWDVRNKLKAKGIKPELIQQAMDYHNKNIKDVSKKVRKGSRDSFDKKGFLGMKKAQQDAAIDKGVKNIGKLFPGRKVDQHGRTLEDWQKEKDHQKTLKIRKDAEQAEAEYDKSQKDKAEELRKYEEGVAKDLGITYDQYKKEMASEKYFGPEEKGRRETKSIMKKPEVKEEKGWWDKMSGGDKAGIAMGVGKGLISARQKYLEAKQKRKERIAAGELEAAKIRAAAGNQLIAAPVSLRKGGRVSFKDVLKAKKKMGY